MWHLFQINRPSQELGYHATSVSFSPPCRSVATSCWPCVLSVSHIRLPSPLFLTKENPSRLSSDTPTPRHPPQSQSCNELLPSPVSPSTLLIYLCINYFTEMIVTSFIIMSFLRAETRFYSSPYLSWHPTQLQTYQRHSVNGAEQKNGQILNPQFHPELILMAGS